VGAFDLQDKSVVITGASSGMGKAAGTSEEVADLVLFLASNRATFISGQGLVIDGGYTAA
jgi:NAD(P)-dependent dehydrogenase (short-subunit alcohol dehydrogenase family)